MCSRPKALRRWAESLHVVLFSHPRAKLTELIALTATHGVWGTQRTHPARLTHPKARPIAPCLRVAGQLWALPSASQREIIHLAALLLTLSCIDPLPIGCSARRERMEAAGFRSQDRVKGMCCSEQNIQADFGERGCLGAGRCVISRG